MANIPTQHNDLSQQTTPKTWLNQVDDGVYVLEKGIVVFALFAMALTYFLDIAHLEFLAKDNALDRLIYRYMGIGSHERPSDSVHDQVHGFISPLILLVAITLLAYGAVQARDRNGTLSIPKKLLQTLAVVVGIGLFWGTVVYVPSNWVMISFFLVILVIYGLQARSKGTTSLVTYVVVWLVMAFPVLSVLYAVGDGYAWSTDVAKIMIMWVGFFGASMATKEQKHISIDFIRKSIPERFRSKYDGLSHTITFLFCVVLLVLAIVYLKQRIDLGAMLSSIHLKAWLIVAPIPVSLAIMVARFFGQAVIAVRGGQVTSSGPGVS